MKLQEQVSLSSFTTFGTGGKARYFIEVKNNEELIEAISFVKKEGLSFFILGEGSNLLISDEGFQGVVIKVSIAGITFEKKDEKTLVRAGAGEKWDSFVEKTVEKNLHGLENLSLIPGTVGAAPVQNIGAYGAEAKDTIVSVCVLDLQSLEFKNISNAECQFGYRDSIFKKEGGKNFIVTEVEFLLEENGKVNSTYKDVKDFFANKQIKYPSLKEVREVVCAIRKNKLPDPDVLGTAGSFFKNPVISKEHLNSLQEKYHLLPFYEGSAGLYKIPAAWILDNVLHLKGFREGNVGLYERQPLALVNLGGATSSEIKNFSDLIIKKFFDVTGIILEREVLLIGAF